MLSENKIFNLSFSKTGTTSFEMSLKNYFNVRLGGWNVYNSQFLLGYCCNTSSDYNLLKDIIKNYDVFSDSPFCNINLLNFYKENYSNSKFVLITRDSDKWVNSLFKMLGIKENNINMPLISYLKPNKKVLTLPEFRTYGFAYFLQTIFDLKIINKDEIKQKYENYNNTILNFFNENKQLKFIHIELTDKDIDKKLGEFLEIENYVFLHENKSL